MPMLCAVPPRTPLRMLPAWMMVQVIRTVLRLMTRSPSPRTLLACAL